MTGTSLHLDTALGCGLRKLFAELEHRLALDRPLTAYLAGGMAVHLYTGKRVTNDVDAEFSARLLIPNDLMVEVLGENGEPELVYIDTNYNPMFALLHENYQQDAIDVDMGLDHIKLRVLSPLDLAISKIARFAEIDREDIQDLVRLGLTSAAAIEDRGSQALRAYIGNVAMVTHNLRDAIALARAVELNQASNGEGAADDSTKRDPLTKRLGMLALCAFLAYPAWELGHAIGERAAKRAISTLLAPINQTTSENTQR